MMEAMPPLGIYVHVPFCASRCGYCDFNTYTLPEVGGESSIGQYVDAALVEVSLARRVLGEGREITTIFFGGGTPTMLPASTQARLLEALSSEFGISSGAEITTEANPESVSPGSLRELRAAGFTRISFGVQSTSTRVLAALDRRHTPGRGLAAVREALDAGFQHVSADLIYGAHGETDEDWRSSVEAVATSGVDHVSAYSLIVEDGTRLGAQVRRGELPAPDEDVLAARYLIADDLLQSKGFSPYEVSNWAVDESAQCRHNLAYWRSEDWWGIGPGAHSHVAGTRWWNVKHPSTYAARLGNGESPAQDREVLTDEQRRIEDVMLRVRLSEGLALDGLAEAAQRKARAACDSGLLDDVALHAGRIVLTQRGRLLADAVIRDLTAA